MVIMAAVEGKADPAKGFFPLTVDYRERTSAAGKFPGGFIKREGRPSTKETLTSRLIDRPIRPLFPSTYRMEVQIQAGPISADRKNDPDVLSSLGASATLVLAENVPFLGPIGAVRLGRIDGQLVPFPTAEEMIESDLDLVVASTAERVVMIEGFGQELPEAEMLAAIMEAHRLNQELIALQHEARAAAGLPPFQHAEDNPDPLIQTLHERYSQALRDAKRIVLKAERNAAVQALQERVVGEMSPPDTEGVPTPQQVKSAFYALQERVVREMILDGYRPDGRGPKDIRPITCEVGVLPGAHGSAIFQRGETQALVTT